MASLNTPQANVSCTTHANESYPFCEPSTRDNSTLDFYHLLLFSVCSVAKAQVFTALTVQEPGRLGGDMVCMVIFVCSCGMSTGTAYMCKCMCMWRYMYEMV
ncbi:hypothetical protein EON63_23470 [archaeon]|nr:MAG: hypothetical protein EON63_23470 [archaeon]